MNILQQFKLLVLVILLFGCESSKKTDIKSTAYQNPMLWADVPDPSVTRKGDDFYLMSTTMHLMPGAPVMKSKDLVHWEIASYVFDSITDNSKYNLLNGTVYGRGQWATSIRYHKDHFYVLFSPNDVPYKSYIYKTKDPSQGNWELISRTKHFHDASLFFDDDGRVYVFYGTGELTELKSDLTGVKPGGIDTKIFERDAEENGLLEGSRVIKRNGKYYLIMISWPKDKPRRQLCYRADNITGPYEKKVILEDDFAGFPYVGQGCIIDDINDNWYGVIFQDRGAVGRVPLLMPVRWENGWPMLGDDNGKVPSKGQVPLETYKSDKPLVVSDDFSDTDALKLNWQWNHNPVNHAWSLTDRKGCLRLNTSRVVNNLYLAPNTLTQRMEGPKCSGRVAMDVSHMKNGDVAGLSAFNGHSALISVSRENDSLFLNMSTNVVHLSDWDKRVEQVDEEIIERVPIVTDKVYLRIDADFNLDKDIATCYYSLDNKNWKPIGVDFKMIFDYRKLFMGSKFAIFNYATKDIGGYIDVDFFQYNKVTK